MSNHSDDSAPRWPNAAPSPADLIGAFTRPPDPRDAEIARLRAEVARIEIQRDAAVQGRQAFRAAYREEREKVGQLTIVSRTKESDELLDGATRLLNERDALRAQLAAAQADNAALRGALEASSVDHGQGPCWCSTESASGRYLAGMDNHQHWSGCSTARAALATPAPGAPLLDAVRGLVAAVGSLAGEKCTDRSCRIHTALAAVRAVLPEPQDAGGGSRGEDAE